MPHDGQGNSTATENPLKTSTAAAAAKMPSTTPTNASPFLLKIHDVETLAQSDGFTLLQEHLAKHCTYDLCDEHMSAHLENNARWLTARDVLYALLVPIVELFDKACSVASQATSASKLEDLEYAFTGQARSAFVWLQCFLSAEKERDWCYSRGCPACVVEHSLDSEYSIRLLYAACLLSDVHYPFTLDGPTLPSFMFFLDSLARALQEDELWGEDFYERMQPKAVVTRNGIEDLTHQCLQLDQILSQPSSPDVATPEMSQNASPILAPVGGSPLTKVKRSKMARKQMNLQVPEEEWMEEMLNRCSDQLSLESDGATTVVETTQSLGATLKPEPEVAVREVPAGE